MATRKWLFAAGLIAAALPAPAATAAPEPGTSAAPPPPPFRPDRTAEDYGFLRDPARRGDWSDGYKFIPLDADGNSWLSLGGELRERPELFDAPRFGLAGGEQDSYVLHRLLIHADLHLGPRVRLFAQLGAYEAIGKAQLAAPDEDHLDAQQLFLELRPVDEVAVRVGRQELGFNPLQRFVSFRDGTNIRQNFDGGRATWAHGPLRIDAFLVRPVQVERGVFDNGPNRDQQFGGVYAAHRLGASPAGSIDAWWLRLDRENLVPAPAAGRERRDSFGLRYAGASDGFDWDAEAVWQTGTSLGRDLDAWAVSADLGYTLPGSPLQPRLGLRFDAGSGDDDPADDKAGGFYPLFPNGRYFNEANVTSWTNLIGLRPSVRIAPTARLNFEAAVQLKWREDVDDAVYLGPSAPLQATRLNRAREIGQAWSLEANYQVNRNLALRGYYLHHSAGDAVSLAGGRAIDFVMGAATLKF